MRKSTDPILISITETARLLALSRPTVLRRIADGTFDAIRIGRTIRVKRESIEAVLAGGEK